MMKSNIFGLTTLAITLLIGGCGSEASGNRETAQRQETASFCAVSKNGPDFLVKCQKDIESIVLGGISSGKSIRINAFVMTIDGRNIVGSNPPENGITFFVNHTDGSKSKVKIG